MSSLSDILSCCCLSSSLMSSLSDILSCCCLAIDLTSSEETEYKSVANVKLTRLLVLPSLLDLGLLQKGRGFPAYVGTGVVPLESHVLKGYWASPELTKASLGEHESNVCFGGIKVSEFPPILSPQAAQGNIFYGP